MINLSSHAISTGNGSADAALDVSGIINALNRPAESSDKEKEKLNNGVPGRENEEIPSPVKPSSKQGDFVENKESFEASPTEQPFEERFHQLEEPNEDKKAEVAEPSEMGIKEPDNKLVKGGHQLEYYEDKFEVAANKKG